MTRFVFIIKFKVQLIVEFYFYHFNLDYCQIKKNKKTQMSEPLSRQTNTPDLLVLLCVCTALGRLLFFPCCSPRSFWHQRHSSFSLDRRGQSWQAPTLFFFSSAERLWDLSATVSRVHSELKPRDQADLKEGRRTRTLCHSPPTRICLTV